ncbi:flippase-like domain-containing protein [bacterium]|nr:flippase-like domain-containing protein [bacterium]
MRKISLYFFSLIGIILFILLIKRIGWCEIKDAIYSLSLWKFFVVCLLMFFAFVLSVYKWKVVLGAFRVKAPFKALLVSRTVGFALSYLTPGIYFGGEPLRAMILKEEINLDWGYNIASIIIDKTLEATINGVVILIGIIYILTHFTLPVWLFKALVFTLFFCVGLLYFFYYKTIHKSGFFTSIIRFFNINKIKELKGIHENLRNIEGYLEDFFCHKKEHLVSAATIGVCAQIINLISFYLIIYFLGARIDIITLISFISLLYAAFFVPIPACLGAQEGSQAIAFSLFNLSVHLGIAFTLISRAIYLMGVVIGLLLLLYFQIKIWGRRIFANISNWGKIIVDAIINKTGNNKK